MNYTALGAAHMVALESKGDYMIKVRMQGTKEDMEWLEEQLKKEPEVLITESSQAFQNKGTNRYYRRYLEIEKQETNKRK